MNAIQGFDFLTSGFFGGAEAAASHFAYRRSQRSDAAREVRWERYADDLERYSETLFAALDASLKREAKANEDSKYWLEKACEFYRNLQKRDQ